jgi:nucleotide-binding universal stress UspA family protein
MKTPGESTPRVVVGVDGSDASRHALRWALGYAEATQGEVIAVAAWQYPPTFGYAPLWGIADFEGPTARMLDEVVGKALADGSPVEVRVRVRGGRPATVLLDEAAGADLLVVGSRGHGAFTGMLLGSVAAHCAQHAPCPVVIVRDRQQAH